MLCGLVWVGEVAEVVFMGVAEVRGVSGCLWV